MPVFIAAAPRAVRAFTIIEVMIALVMLAIALTAIAGGLVAMHRAERSLWEDRRALDIAQAVVERIQGEDWNTLGQFPWSWHRREDAATTFATFPLVETLGAPNVAEMRHRPLTDEPTGPNLFQYLRRLNDNGIAGPDLKDFTLDPWGLPFVVKEQQDAYGSPAPAAQAPSGPALPATLVDKYNTPLRYNWLQFVGILDEPSGLDNLRVYLEYYNQDTLQLMASDKTWREARSRTGVLPDAITPHILPQSHLLLNFGQTGQGIDFSQQAVLTLVIVLWDRQEGGSGRHEVLVARRK